MFDAQWCHSMENINLCKSHMTYFCDSIHSFRDINVSNLWSWKFRSRSRSIRSTFVHPHLHSERLEAKSFKQICLELSERRRLNRHWGYIWLRRSACGRGQSTLSTSCHHLLLNYININWCLKSCRLSVSHLSQPRVTMTTYLRERLQQEIQFVCLCFIKKYWYCAENVERSRPYPVLAILSYHYMFCLWSTTVWSMCYTRVT